MTNPFDPTSGAIPARIVGREAELGGIREALRRAATRYAASPNIFVGLRGMGKSSLLAYLRHLSNDTSLVVALEALPGQTLADRLSERVDRLLGDARTWPNRTARAFRKALRALPKLSYQLPHATGGFSIGANTGETDDPHVDRFSFAAMLGALETAAEHLRKPLVITVDEVQDADLVSLQTLATFVNQAQPDKAPIVLAAAGLSQTRDRLDRMRTYVQRWNVFDLRMLTREETIAAVREPIVVAKWQIDEDALYRLVAETGGYPYFVQAFASAAWELRDSRRPLAR